MLALGLFAIIALTVMNVFSLYDIRDRMTEGEEERQFQLAEELVRDVRQQIYTPFSGLREIELEPVEYFINSSGQFPPQLKEGIINASKNPLFDGIYFTPESIDPCQEGASIYGFNYSNNELELTSEYPSILCDGLVLARTKARIELNSFNYRWNNNVEFDAHRTMNIGFINLEENRVIGYLTITLNKDQIVNGLISPLMNEYFSADTAGGTVLWLHDWLNNEVLATNNNAIEYDIDLVDQRRVRFGTSMFSEWNIKVAFLDNSIATMYNATLVKNLIILGFAFLFLIGALLFMFFTAQRERALSLRQAGFLANVTHELKTPLAVMQAAGENISDGRVTDPIRLQKYGDHIYSEAIRLKKMIDKLLDVAKSDSGQALINAAPVDANELLRFFVSENRAYIEAKGFNLDLKLSDSRPLIMADKDNLENILSNLTENALKYSSDNKNILFSVVTNQKEIIINISDTGIGIPKKHHKNIFKKFYRVEDSLKAKTKGHGLGLSIVKNLVELNGGDVTLKSEVNIGTTFRLRFPVLIPNEKTLNNQKNRITSTSITENNEYAQ